MNHMSVPKPEREEHPMDVQLAAIALAKYTMEEAEKETVVSKRSRWSLGDRMIDAALDAAGHLDIANSMKLEIPEEARERLVRQDMANANLFRLKTLIRIARERKLFPSKKEESWVRMVTDVQRMLGAWKESDRNRKKSFRPH